MRKQSIADEDLRKMLSAVFQLCLLNESGKRKGIDDLVAAARRDATRRIASLRPSRSTSMDLVLLGSILHRWNRDGRYLDDEARPLSIRATGPAPSIAALFREEGKPRYFHLGLQHMVAANLVRKVRPGIYAPRNDAILLHTLTPEMVANVSLAINRLVSTLLQNTATRRKSALRLIERNALVHDLPKDKLQEFKTFSREQGAALISTMNDWLETRRIKKNIRQRKPGHVTAGIHVFAFHD